MKDEFTESGQSLSANLVLSLSTRSRGRSRRSSAGSGRSLRLWADSCSLPSGWPQRSCKRSRAKEETHLDLTPMRSTTWEGISGTSVYHTEMDKSECFHQLSQNTTVGDVMLTRGAAAACCHLVLRHHLI